jgi:hypothetical protein
MASVKLGQEPGGQAVAWSLGPTTEKVMLKDIDFPPCSSHHWDTLDDGHLSVMSKTAEEPGGPIYDVIQGHHKLKALYATYPDDYVCCVVYKSTDIPSVCTAMLGDQELLKVGGGVHGCLVCIWLIALSTHTHTCTRETWKMWTTNHHRPATVSSRWPTWPKSPGNRERCL